MSSTFTLVAYGAPQSMGSKRSIPLRRKDGSPVYRPDGSLATVTTDGNPKLADWRAEVRRAFRDAYPKAVPLLGPVSLVVVFHMARPAGHYGTGRNAGLLKASAPHWQATKKADLDKMLRAVKDSLTTYAYRDDCQVCHVIASKVYSDHPGAVIEVAALDEAANKDAALPLLD